MQEWKQSQVETSTRPQTGRSELGWMDEWANQSAERNLLEPVAMAYCAHTQTHTNSKATVDANIPLSISPTVSLSLIV